MHQSQTPTLQKPLIRTSRDRIPPTKYNGVTFGVLRIFNKQHDERKIILIRHLHNNRTKINLIQKFQGQGCPYNVRPFLQTSRQRISFHLLHPKIGSGFKTLHGTDLSKIYEFPTPQGMGEGTMQVNLYIQDSQLSAIFRLGHTEEIGNVYELLARQITHIYLTNLLGIILLVNFKLFIFQL